MNQQRSDDAEKISQRDDDVEILHPSGKPTLEELIAGITDENRHELIDFGPPVGKEVW